MMAAMMLAVFSSIYNALKLTLHFHPNRHIEAISFSKKADESCAWQTNIFFTSEIDTNMTGSEKRGHFVQAMKILLLVYMDSRSLKLLLPLCIRT